MADRTPSSMQDVADLSGVSVATVSRALRGSPLVNAATRERVVAAATELGFAVSRAASSLATGRLDKIAVLVSGRLDAWFNGSILEAIYQPLHAARFELIIYRILDEAERREFFATLPARRNADALIVASFAPAAAERARLSELGMPLVYLNQRVAGAASVAIDDYAAARSGVQELVGLGHRRIGFATTGRPIGMAVSAADRIEGYRDELAAADAGPEQIYIAASSADGPGLVEQWKAAAPRPTALLVSSDDLALALLAALADAGVNVPGELSVLGFDDHTLAERFGLSTIGQPVDELGRRAAEMALTLARGGSLRINQAVLPTRVIARRTTGPPLRSDQA